MKIKDILALMNQKQYIVIKRFNKTLYEGTVNDFYEEPNHALKQLNIIYIGSEKNFDLTFIMLIVG